jgi:hypothetical protein
MEGPIYPRENAWCCRDSSAWTGAPASESEVAAGRIGQRFRGSDVVVEEGAEVAVSGLGGDPVDRGAPLTAAVVAWPARSEWPVTGMPSKPAWFARACTSRLTARGPMRSLVAMPDR